MIVVVVNGRGATVNRRVNIVGARVVVVVVALGGSGDVVVVDLSVLVVVLASVVVGRSAMIGGNVGIAISTVTMPSPMFPSCDLITTLGVVVTSAGVSVAFGCRMIGGCRRGGGRCLRCSTIWTIGWLKVLGCCYSTLRGIWPSSCLSKGEPPAVGCTHIHARRDALPWTLDNS